MTVYDNDVVEDYEELVLTLVAPAPVIVANGSDTVTVHIVEDSNDCELFNKNDVCTF